ncbi:DUF1917-domain-containing protein [Parathielavia appendiculata]|uniref:DUF1917-domain-containing protein n=1 Tax=Parathielavia appendiculata TaxID=2587402 RepID=A0AAN6U0I1_9PEZI|nr:DUF1917-domain-containing protein [Parathielavia appendiculata]
MDPDSDSDLYGDEETISDLKTRVNEFDAVAWWEEHPSTTKLLHRQQTSQSHTQPLPISLHNPYQGLQGAWRLSSETIPQFSARLPPAITDCITSTSTSTTTTTTTTTVEGRSPASRQRDVADVRRETSDDLKELAASCNVVAGKWMLFSEPGYVNEVWGRVARSTAENELGIEARVETRKDDVARVLNRMKGLELVRPGGRQIYYESDAWTELGIYGGNSCGIGASTYSSNEIFRYIMTAASRRS